MLQFVTIVDSICFGYVQKGAVARHRNPVVQFDLDMSKRSSAKIVQGNQRKNKKGNLFSLARIERYRIDIDHNK